MTAIQTRASVLAVVKETTEGTPVAPSGATDFIALQPDFSMTPAFESLTNDELRNSIGQAKPIQGLETPSASYSAYLRASGVVAQAPNYGEFLEAAFGAVATASTEYDTVSSSTTSVIKVNTGEGATFQRGEPLLIKDGTNGYRIRCLDSISGDDLTTGFQVPVAPGTGVNLGRAVLYYPANTSHPTVSLWHYLGNGGGVQMLSGGRVTNMSIDIAAGQLINATYDLEGVKYYFNPITIASTDTKLDFTDDDGTWAATIAEGVYKDPHELASAIQTAMRTANAGETATVTYSNTTGKFTIKTTGTVLSLLWSSGSNAANTIGDKIGFVTGSNDTGTAATTGYTSDNAITLTAPYTPSYDSADPLAAKDHEVMVGTTTDYACFAASSVSISMGTPKSNILSVCSTSGVSGSIVSSREVTIEISALLNQYDADKFRRVRENDETKFQYSFGVKSGGSWVAGKCGAIYAPTCTVSAIALEDADGLVQMNLTLTAFVNSSGEGEFFIGFV